MMGLRSVQTIKLATVEKPLLRLVPGHLLTLALSPIVLMDEIADGAVDQLHMTETYSAHANEAFPIEDGSPIAFLLAAETLFDSDMAIDLENDADSWPSTDN